eukprot:1155712-Pelagomonas_calceolata.AAC.3
MCYIPVLSLLALMLLYLCALHLHFCSLPLESRKTFSPAGTGPSRGDELREHSTLLMSLFKVPTQAVALHLNLLGMILLVNADERKRDLALLEAGPAADGGGAGGKGAPKPLIPKAADADEEDEGEVSSSSEEEEVCACVRACVFVCACVYVCIKWAWGYMDA